MPKLMAFFLSFFKPRYHKELKAVLKSTIYTTMEWQNIHEAQEDKRLKKQKK